MPLKIDLHTHTCYSEDATTTLEELTYHAKNRGLDGVVVTDHDTVEGALRLTRQKPKSLTIIPGIEVSTLHGHVLALGITQPVTPKMNIVETVERIHQLGGIAVIAHPSVVLKTRMGHSLSSTSGLDAVEVINSSAFPFFLSTRLSRRLAQRLGLPQTAGSDAHHPREVGNAYTIIDADSNQDDIIETVRKGKTVPFGKPTSWRLKLQRGAFNVKRKLGGRWRR